MLLLLDDGLSWWNAISAKRLVATISSRAGSGGLNRVGWSVCMHAMEVKVGHGRARCKRGFRLGPNSANKPTPPAGA